MVDQGLGRLREKGGKAEVWAGVTAAARGCVFLRMHLEVGGLGTKGKQLMSTAGQRGSAFTQVSRTVFPLQPA